MFDICRHTVPIRRPGVPRTLLVKRAVKDVVQRKWQLNYIGIIISIYRRQTIYMASGGVRGPQPCSKPEQARDRDNCKDA